MRSKALSANPSSIMTGHIRCAEDPYTSKNTTGYLNFGIAENHLMNEILLKKINQPITITTEHIQYKNVFGLPKLQETVSSFLSVNLGIKNIDPKSIVIQAGVSAICESLSFALFDEGDYIMIPTPYYTGFDHDFTKRFNTVFLKTPLDPEASFKHQIKTFKQTYSDFPQKNKVKAILITSPHNPTGELLSAEFIIAIIKFAKENDLHLICDEIYALSNQTDKSYSSLFQKAIEAGAKAHLLYGMAKDFAVAGFKTGFFYSPDSELTASMHGLTYFHPVSTYTQEIIYKTLEDQNFINQFISINKERLNRAKTMLKDSLPELNFIPAEAGLFMLLDLSTWCKNFQDEDIIFNDLLDNLKLNFSKGQDLGMTRPGYFRVCFARSDTEIKELCMRLKNLKRPKHG